MRNKTTEKDSDDLVRPFREHGTWKKHPGVLIYRKSSVSRKSLVLLASSEKEQDDWIHLLRILVAPLQLIQNYAVSIAEKSSKIEMKLYDLIPAVKDGEVSLVSESIAEKFGEAGKVFSSSKEILEEYMKGTAIVADLSRFVFVVGAACYLVSAAVKVAYIVSVALRARQELPKVHKKLCELADKVTHCIWVLLSQNKPIDPSRIEDALEKLDECLLMLDGIENYILKNFVSQAIFHKTFAENVEDQFRRIRADIQIEDLEIRMHQIDNRLKKLEEFPQATRDEFISNTSRPHTVSRIIHDFKEESSAERKLRDELLRDISEEDGKYGKYVAAIGMGGIGKTTSLIAICRRDDIHETFKDGVSFMQFGENAAEKDVIGFYWGIWKEKSCARNDFCIIHTICSCRWIQVARKQKSSSGMS